MSQVDRRLLAKVEKIVGVWIFLHIVLYTVGLMYSGVDSVGMIGSSTFGLMTCILLFVAVREKTKYLLIPFMFYMSLLFAFFSLILCFYVLHVGGLIFEHGLTRFGIYIFGIPVISILPALTAWALRATYKCYSELRRIEECIENCILGNLNHRGVIVHHRVQADVEMAVVPISANLPPLNQSSIAPSVSNDPPPQYNQIFVTPNANQCHIASPVPNELQRQYNEASTTLGVINSSIASIVPSKPPPQYNEAHAVLNDGVDVLPTYDEAMAVNQQNI